MGGRDGFKRDLRGQIDGWDGGVLTQPRWSTSQAVKESNQDLTLAPAQTINPPTAFCCADDQIPGSDLQEPEVIWLLPSFLTFFLLHSLSLLRVILSHCRALALAASRPGMLSHHALRCSSLLCFSMKSMKAGAVSVPVTMVSLNVCAPSAKKGPNKYLLNERTNYFGTYRASGYLQILIH